MEDLTRVLDGRNDPIYRPTGRPQYATATADLKHVTWVPQRSATRRQLSTLQPAPIHDRLSLTASYVQLFSEKACSQLAADRIGSSSSSSGGRSSSCAMRSQSSLARSNSSGAIVAASTSSSSCA